MNQQRTLDQADLAQTFAALGDPCRVAIIARLTEEETLSLSQLCLDAEITRQAVSKHLKRLSAANLVSSEKSGRETLYRLEVERLEIANQFLNEVAHKWDNALARLKEQVEAK